MLDKDLLAMYEYSHKFKMLGVNWFCIFVKLVDLKLLH